MEREHLDSFDTERTSRHLTLDYHLSIPRPMGANGPFMVHYNFDLLRVELTKRRRKMGSERVGVSRAASSCLMPYVWSLCRLCLIGNGSDWPLSSTIWTLYRTEARIDWPPRPLVAPSMHDVASLFFDCPEPSFRSRWQMRSCISPVYKVSFCRSRTSESNQPQKPQ